MKRAIIIHCWGGHSNYAWYQSVAAQLTEMGYIVQVPDMPGSDTPLMDAWVPYLDSIVGEPDEDLVLVGHSVGTVTIMRYLETLRADQRIDRALLVAGFTDPLGSEELKNFFKTPLHYTTIKAKVRRGFVVIQSDDDPYVSAEQGVRLRDALGATLVIKHAAGHMSGEVDNEDACTELPEVAENI